MPLRTCLNVLFTGLRQYSPTCQPTKQIFFLMGLFYGDSIHRYWLLSNRRVGSWELLTEVAFTTLSGICSMYVLYYLCHAQNGFGILISAESFAFNEQLFFLLF